MVQVYLAAVYTNQYMKGQRQYEGFNDVEKEKAEYIKTTANILESWHYVHKQKFVDEMRASGAKVFLDSGAFSAWTLGVTLSIEAYCDYIKRNEDILRKEDGVIMASVLDGIGDALQTYRNQREMEVRGVTPLPCYHFGEDTRYLDYYADKYPYITIGGMVGKTPAQLELWLDRIWDKHLTDGAGRPKVRVHGFGLTSIPLMERYPWYSCDSSSWIQTTAFGNVVFPQYGPISVSEKSPSRQDQGRHFSTYTKYEQEHLTSIMAEKGFDFERLSTKYESRAAWNMLAYMQIERDLNERKGHDILKEVARELF